MNHEGLVREAVREYNADFATKGWVAIAMGVLTSLLVYAFILVVCFFFFCLSAAPWYLVGTVIFGIFFGVSWWSCTRGVDPIDGVRPVDEDDLGAMKVATLVTGLPMSPRHTIAGAAGLVMHGPASIIEGRSMLASLLPTDDATIRGAAEVLAGLLEDKTVSIEAINPKMLAFLLVRTGLARPDRKGSTSLVATMKAREGGRG
jgi:hypothetical protein